jgi:hypothetical protein
LTSGVDQRVEPFLDLSVLLTGYDRVQLLGTGMADGYLCALEEALPSGVLDELLGAYERLPRADREAAVASAILGDPKLGPVARNVILLWYCGTWTALPEAWRTAYGTSPLDTSRAVSAEAYQAGLQWVAAGAHPIGARQQGYGAWAVPPESVSR